MRAQVVSEGGQYAWTGALAECAMSSREWYEMDN